MASHSVHQDASAQSHPARRPHMVKLRHTWHGEMPYRSHFEDFMREIGVDAQATHLCCIPRQVPKNYIRVRAKSEPAPVAAVQDGAVLALYTVQSDRERSGILERNVRRQSFPTTTLKRLFSPPPVSPRPALPSHVISAPSYRDNEDSSRSPTVPLKTRALISVYTQNHGASYISTTVSADQALRNTMKVTLVGELSRRGSPQEPHAGQDHWEPLPHCPALVPAKPSSTGSLSPLATPKRTVSRVPSFASLETTSSESSSEGPETPRGHYSLLSSPASQAMSPTTLSELEKASRIRVPGQCVTCKRAGHNFPSCPACGDMWCSRECRVRANRGHPRHGCLTGRKNITPTSEVVVPAASLTGYAAS